MKLLNQKLILAVAAATIVFATGCTKKASRPTPDQTVIGTGAAVSASDNAMSDGTSGMNASANAGLNASANAAQTSGSAGTYTVGTAFGTGAAQGPQNVFNPVTTGAAAQADTVSARTEGTQVGDQIRGIPSLPPVYFDFDRYAIKTSEFSKIKALKDYLAKNPTQKVLIEGYCDWRGTVEYNMALGDRRANAVKRYAISIGIPAAKIQTRSLGSTQAAERGTEAEMAKDRRGEIVILVK